MSQIVAAARVNGALGQGYAKAYGQGNASQSGYAESDRKLFHAARLETHENRMEFRT
jgi:hypothetical protein